MTYFFFVTQKLEKNEMMIYNGKTKIFYPLGGHQYTLHKCSTLSSEYFHVVCNVMQNKKKPAYVFGFSTRHNGRYEQGKWL